MPHRLHPGCPTRDLISFLMCPMIRSKLIGNCIDIDIRAASPLANVLNLKKPHHLSLTVALLEKDWADLANMAAKAIRNFNTCKSFFEAEADGLSP